MNKTIMQQEEPRRHFRVGSTYFFNMYPGFTPKDYDEVIFEKEPNLYRNVMQFQKHDKTHCLFKWRKMAPDEFVEYTLNSRLPMEIGKFLIPEVVSYLGFTLDHLKKLQPVVDRLDDKHRYEKVIFDSYIENGDFILTQEQRDAAYSEYRMVR